MCVGGGGFVVAQVGAFIFDGSFRIFRLAGALAAAKNRLRRGRPHRGQFLRGAARDGTDENVEAGVRLIAGGAEAEILDDHGA